LSNYKSKKEKAEKLGKKIVVSVSVVSCQEEGKSESEGEK